MLLKSKYFKKELLLTQFLFSNRGVVPLATRADFWKVGLATKGYLRAQQTPEPRYLQSPLRRRVGRMVPCGKPLLGPPGTLIATFPEECRFSSQGWRESAAWARKDAANAHPLVHSEPPDLSLLLEPTMAAWKGLKWLF